MTSLSNQLEVLRNATARQLTVEKRHISLIFDKREAGKLDNQTAHRIGVAGLEQMKRVDPVFDTEKLNDLFEETKIGFVRSMLSKEENASLDEKIEKILFELAPYLQHFACQQVLEYLVHTYQIYAYNAETLIITFLPFHDTKIYARILAILDFDFSRSKEWAFMEKFKRQEIPIPFTSIMSATMAGTHSIVTRLSDHIKKGVEVVGNDYLESRSPVLFNFYAKLLLSLFQDTQKVDEALLAKLMVFIVAGIKSPMLSFRQASLMIICQLVLTVKLKADILASITKLLLMKIRPDTALTTLSTIVVVCQQQELDTFSTKAFEKMLKHNDELQLSKQVKELARSTDLIKFYKPFWGKLFELITSEDGELSSLAEEILSDTTDAPILSKNQAELFLTMVVEQSKTGLFLTNKKSKSAVITVANRFVAELDRINDEWLVKDASVLKKFLDYYELNSLLVVKPISSPTKRSRRRSNSMRKSIGDEPVKMKKTAAEKARELADASEYAKRRVFQGDPLFKAREFLEEEAWEKLEWALQEIAARPASYLHGKPEDDVEELVVDLIALSINKSKVVNQATVKTAISMAKIRDAFTGELLTRQSSEKATKKARGERGAVQNPVKKAFVDESNEQFGKRVLFVLNVLHMKKDLHAGPQIFKALFDIVKEVNAKIGDADSFLHQQLAVNVLIRLLENPGKYTIIHSDLDLDCVVEAMRSTTSHHLLRDCLRLLTATVRHSPAEVIKHIMSIFTFMGNGLLKKDNEMTLSIVERTVESLFEAIVNAGNLKGPSSSGKERETLQLIEVARLFANSAVDIPAHRRARVAQAIGRSVRAENAATVTLVMLSGFCARWQRINDAAAQQEAVKRGTDQEAYEDFAIELLASLGPFEQLSAVLDMIAFVLRLGGDQVPDGKGKNKPSAVDLAVFDRSAVSIPRLRHFRFVIISLIAKVFASRTLIEKLAAFTDDELLAQALPQGKRLMEFSVELDDFSMSETEKISEADAQTQRYWVAFASRAEVVSEKLRHLLPGGVAARLIAEILSDKSGASYKLQEKALQLANIKLGHTGYFFTDSGINERELVVLATVLNKFIGAETKDAQKMLLCQNAAYTLKLIAKNLPLQSESTVLAETMTKCVETASKYQRLDENLTGNILLLAGELIRSHNMRSTMHQAISLLKICVSILQECVTKFTAKSLEGVRGGQPEEKKNRGQRIRQISLGGLRLGSDTLLICSLTCTQRIFDQYASFVSEHVGDVVVAYCKLSGRFGNAEVESLNNSMQQLMAIPHASGSQASGNVNKSSVQHRLSLIKRALLTIELRVVPQHFSKAVNDLINDHKALGSLFTLLAGYFEPSNRQTVSKTCCSLMENIFLPALDYRSSQRKVDLFDSATRVEKRVFDAVIAIANTLSEHEFRPVFNLLVGWAEVGLTTKSTLPQRLRLLVLFHFANSFYEVFHALALPYFVRLLELIKKVLRGCNVTMIEDASKLLLTGKRGSLEALETDLVLTLAIDVIANAARHKEFFTPDRCAQVSDTLVDELVNTKVEGHEERCTKHLVFALYRIADADPDSFADLLNKILLKTRDNRPKIRYRTLLVVEILLERIGDGIQPHLSLLVPFLNELIEDENKQVEEQCQQVVNVLQHKFGDKFWQGSSFV